MINNNMTTYDFYYKEYERKLTKQIYTQPYYDDLLKITNFLSENSHYAERIYCLLNDIKERPLCEHCGGMVKFPHHLRKEERGYRRFCSTKCSNNNENVQKEKSKTCVANYGVDNPSKSKIIHNRKVKTIMENYGGFMCGSPIIKEKIYKTNLEKYGFIHPSKNKKVKRKIKKSHIERYKNDYYKLFSCNHSKSATKYIKKFIKDNSIDENLCLYGNDELKIKKDVYNEYFFDLVVFKSLDGLMLKNIEDISIILEYDGCHWHPNIDQAITFSDVKIPRMNKTYREKYRKDLLKKKFARDLVMKSNGKFILIREEKRNKNLNRYIP